MALAPRRKPLAPLQVRAPDIEAWLLEREPTAIGSWRDMGADEYARSFTAAQTAGTDIADDLYYALVDVVARGGDEQDFGNLVMPILRQKGWLGDEGKRAVRVALIYDTNLRIARAAGRWQGVQASKTGLPYLRGVTVGDDRVRHPPKSPHSDHRAWNGIILPVDHTFWLSYWIPLGFRCRCGIIQMTRSELARYKGGVTSEPELAERIAELGPPVFRAPGLPLGVQLSSMVAPTNESLMPGMPPVDPIETRQAGLDAWSAILTTQASKVLDDLLAKLFGQAA